MGTPALTSRGFAEADFETVANFIHRGVEITKEVNASGVGKKLVEFKAALKQNSYPKIDELKKDVEEFASKASEPPAVSSSASPSLPPSHCQHCPATRPLFPRYGRSSRRSVSKRRR